MSRTHLMPIEILFKHCDPAGIVFYPRYVEMLHDTVEHWFNHGLKIPFCDLHSVHGLGIPMANLNVDFRAPCRMGELVHSHLSVIKLGRTSMQLSVRLIGPDETLRLAGRLTIVFASVAEIRPVEIPADFRQLLQDYQQDEPIADAAD